jgi:hypothetical protein
MNKINPLDICKDCLYLLEEFNIKEEPFDIEPRLKRHSKPFVIENYYCTQNNTPLTCFRDKENLNLLIEDLEWVKVEEKRTNRIINLFTLGIIILAIIIIRYLIKGDLT